VPDAASATGGSSADETADQLDDVFRHALVRKRGRDPLRKDANRRKS
jgi:hypothetical protein